MRNHHYSLQILTELKSRSIEFRNILKRCEEKSKCEGRSLDVFLTYPMHQVKKKFSRIFSIKYLKFSKKNNLDSKIYIGTSSINRTHITMFDKRA